MNKKENHSGENIPLREKDHIENNEMPYDPNITKEDKQALKQSGQNDYLRDREQPVDFTADELDIPGRDEADTSHRGKNIPDEENFQYDESGIKKKPFNEDQIPDEEA